MMVGAGMKPVISPTYLTKIEPLKMSDTVNAYQSFPKKA